MSVHVLISAPYFQPVAHTFEDVWEREGITITLPSVEERLTEEELLRLLPGVHGVVGGDDRFTRRVLEGADSLRVISKWGTGTDSIDREAAAELGVAVYNTANAFSHPVADSVLGYILAFSRNIVQMDRLMKAGRWEKTMGTALNETIIGVIGVGNVGTQVLRRAGSFGAALLGTDIRDVDSRTTANLGVQMVSLEHLLAESDFVSVNCDLNPSSHHLIGQREFELMKRSTFLVNTARGLVVDENALVLALETRALAGAALDVFEDEPLPADSPLRSMQNVLLAPHNSNSSPSAWQRVHQSTVDNLVRGLRIRSSRGNRTDEGEE